MPSGDVSVRHNKRGIPRIGVRKDVAMLRNILLAENLLPIGGACSLLPRLIDNGSKAEESHIGGVADPCLLGQYMVPSLGAFGVLSPVVARSERLLRTQSILLGNISSTCLSDLVST